MKIRTIIEKGREIYRDQSTWSRYTLNLSLAANIAFALLELAEGLYFGSLWLICVGMLSTKAPRSSGQQCARSA